VIVFDGVTIAVKQIDYALRVRTYCQLWKDVNIAELIELRDYSITPQTYRSWKSLRGGCDDCYVRCRSCGWKTQIDFHGVEEKLRLVVIVYSKQNFLCNHCLRLANMEDGDHDAFHRLKIQTYLRAYGADEKSVEYVL